jgi:hypothetical protein
MLEKHNILLQAIHVKGVMNTQADSLSRLSRSGDYSLQQGVLRSLQRNLEVVVSCDLFANFRNKQAKRYVSLSLNDRGAMARDAFTISWKGLGLPLIHPPIPLIQRCVNKVKEEGVVAVMITPAWEGQWWSTALNSITIKSTILGESESVLEKGAQMVKHGDKLPPGKLIARLVNGGMTSEKTSYTECMQLKDSQMYLSIIDLPSEKTLSEITEEV